MKKRRELPALTETRVFNQNKFLTMTEYQSRVTIQEYIGKMSQCYSLRGLLDN